MSFVDSITAGAGEHNPRLAYRPTILSHFCSRQRRYSFFQMCGQSLATEHPWIHRGG